MNARFIAWLVGVDVTAVQTYRDIADWPSDWSFRAQHHLRSLGVSSHSDAMSVFVRLEG